MMPRYMMRVSPQPDTPSPLSYCPGYPYINSFKAGCQLAKRFTCSARDRMDPWLDRFRRGVER